MKATETIDPKVAPGQTIVAAWISEPKPAVNAKSVRETLAKTALKQLDDQSRGADDLAITLEAKNGARVTITLGNYQGSILGDEDDDAVVRGHQGPLRAHEDHYHVGAVPPLRAVVV